MIYIAEFSILSLMLLCVATCTGFCVRWLRGGRFPLRWYDRRLAPWGVGQAILLILASFLLLNGLLSAFCHVAKDVSWVNAVRGTPCETDSVAVNSTTSDSVAAGDSDTVTVDTSSIPTDSTIPPSDASASQHSTSSHSTTTDQPSQHPVLRAMREGGPIMWCVAFFLAVIVAPFSEELLFRLLLIAGLETSVWRWHAHKPRTACHVYGRTSVWIVVSSAVLFGSLHFRSAAMDQMRTLPWQWLLLTGVGQLLISVLLLVVLRCGYRANWTDLGFDRRYLASDIQLGVVTALMVIVPVFMIQLLAMYGFQWLGVERAADPIPIFFLAIALGVLFFRTRRLLPCIVLHACFNGVAFLLSLLQMAVQAS